MLCFVVVISTCFIARAICIHLAIADVIVNVIIIVIIIIEMIDLIKTKQETNIVRLNQSISISFEIIFISNTF